MRALEIDNLRCRRIVGLWLALRWRGRRHRNGRADRLRRDGERGNICRCSERQPVILGDCLKVIDEKSCLGIASGGLLGERSGEDRVHLRRQGGIDVGDRWRRRVGVCDDQLWGLAFERHTSGQRLEGDDAK